MSPTSYLAKPSRIDKVIRIRGVHFRVIGVSEKKGAIFGNSLDQFAVIPLGAFRKLFGARQSLQVMVRPRDPAFVAVAKDDARVALRVARRLEPAEPDNFGIVSSDSVLDIYNQATAGIFAVLVGVVALSLVVGGIVIMNIMLMVVSERTREIGLRKALGAKRRDIMSQVLTESITLSFTGGIVGVAIGAHGGQRPFDGDATASDGSAVVGGDRRLDHRDRRAVLRMVSGPPRVDARPHRGAPARVAMSKLVARFALLKETAQMALDTLRVNKLRSALTVLGIVIGITSIVGMTSLIRGFDESLQNTIRMLGPKTIFVAKFSALSLSSGDVVHGHDAAPEHHRPGCRSGSPAGARGRHRRHLAGQWWSADVGARVLSAASGPCPCRSWARPIAMSKSTPARLSSADRSPKARCSDEKQ